MMNCQTFTLSLVIALSALGSSVLRAADDGSHACSCTDISCGNYAIGGNRGDVFTGVSGDEADNYFETNPDTGWTCVIPALIRNQGSGPLACFCENSCGNGGVAADANYFDLGLTQQDVDSSYGGGQSGNQTGWQCGNYRGDFEAVGLIPPPPIVPVPILGGFPAIVILVLLTGLLASVHLRRYS